jgi:hypothetical protein
MVRFQKLRTNLFLTLDGHSIHCQQRELSMFLMHYQQFASHSYSGAAGPVSVSLRLFFFIIFLFEETPERLFRGAVPYLRRLVAGFPPRRPRFEPRSGHVGFVVDLHTHN